MASELEEEEQRLRYRYALVPPDRGNHTLLVTRRPDVLRLAAPRAVSRSATELVTLTLSLLRFRGDLEQRAEGKIVPRPVHEVAQETCSSRYMGCTAYRAQGT